MGRHARALATRGYSVTGVDRDINIVTQARESGGGPIYVQAELREYQPGKESYDAVIVMGQSFGHFEPATNRDVLERLAGALRKGGRMVLDLWNAGFFASHQGERDFYLPDAVIRETKKVEDGRLFVHLTYPNGEEEDFAWELFTPTKMELLIATLPVSLIGCCTDFHTSGEPCVSKPRIQFILERSA